MGGETEKVINGEDEFMQTDVDPDKDAVSKEFTVIVATPVCVCEQAVALPSLTLTRL